MLDKRALASYAVLGLPLAFAGLPAYLYFPTFYSQELGLSMTLVGVIILLSRLIDTAQDPFIGWLSDRWCKDAHSRYRLIAIGAPFMVVGFLMLFMPPALEGLALGAWLFAALVITYLAYSFISINYQGLPPELSGDYIEQSRLTTAREVGSLFGVLLASILPFLLAAQYGVASGYAILAAVFGVLMVAATVIAYRFGPTPVYTARRSVPFLPQFKQAFRDEGNRYLFLAFFLNALAASIPASVFLIFVQHVLGAPSQSGYFLMVYFLCGAGGLPLWLMLIKRIGKQRTWQLSMITTILVFFWAIFLGTGDILQFYIICALSGFCFGADLSIPPSMLGDRITDKSQSGSYFGIWMFLTKLSLALAGGLSFLVLGVSEFEAADTSVADKTFLLAVVYAGIPCAIKLAAFALLARKKLEHFTPPSSHPSPGKEPL